MVKGNTNNLDDKLNEIIKQADNKAVERYSEYSANVVRTIYQHGELNPSPRQFNLYFLNDLIKYKNDFIFKYCITQL